MNKERIKSDNLPLFFSFENDVIDTSQALKIIIIQTAARQFFCCSWSYEPQWLASKAYMNHFGVT